MARSLLAFLGMTLVGLSGCGSGSASANADPDRQAVGLLVTSLADRAKTPKDAAEQFVDLKPDAKLCKRISGLMFVPSEVVVEGDSARVKLKIYNAETSDEVGEANWTAAKLDGKWKLKDATIP